ncbi:hypothetical protein KUG88_02525 [Rhodococcus rhodochrous]|uniref:hypothetical protein n=1 Tax=Rhodococcus rhodochrous TaxID=1829 RepID=UPI001E363A79|nr:hypothetical protein [Rhodococcus rhodochrous]MCB8909011.1 hypothetical protein [Rhodococcus rhodochrous]
MTAVAVGNWGDPGADPPHEWDQARTELEESECAIAGLVQENNELRAIIRRVREYAQASHQDADDIRKYGNPYAALPYENAALALERIIGDRP